MGRYIEITILNRGIVKQLISDNIANGWEENVNTTKQNNDINTITLLNIGLDIIIRIIDMGGYDSEES